MIAVSPDDVEAVLTASETARRDRLRFIEARSGAVLAAKGLLLGEDRPESARCSGCDLSYCEPCRQVSA